MSQHHVRSAVGHDIEPDNVNDMHHRHVYRAYSIPEEEHDMTSHESFMQRFERTVVDTVALFMSQPSLPLQAGAVRAFILALEAILRHGLRRVRPP
jgi:hypothetical protein